MSFRATKAKKLKRRFSAIKANTSDPSRMRPRRQATLAFYRSMRMISKRDAGKASVYRHGLRRPGLARPAHSGGMCVQSSIALTARYQLACVRARNWLCRQLMAGPAPAHIAIAIRSLH